MKMPENKNIPLTWHDVQALIPGVQLLLDGKPVEVSLVDDKNSGRFFIFKHIVEGNRHVISSRLISPSSTSALAFDLPCMAVHDIL